MRVGAPRPRVIGGKGNNFPHVMAGNNSLFKVDTHTMKSINDECTGNIELQLLVISFIAEWKDKGMDLQDCMT